MKVLLSLVFLIVSYANDSSLLNDGVKIVYTDDNHQEKNITVKREINRACKKIPITNEIFWENGYADDTIPNACKSTFITSGGKSIFPMKIHPKIETVAELEVLEFINKMQSDPTMLLVDSRGEEWYSYRTIPGAINIHYMHMMDRKIFANEFKKAMTLLGIKELKGAYDFSGAKKLLLFCNGAWCSQSPQMIKALLDLGYPPEKIKWYRGGMEDWLGLSMTTTRDKRNL